MGYGCQRRLHFGGTQGDLKQGILHIRWKKWGTPATHPLRGPEFRALRQPQRTYPDTPYLFVTERGGPMIERTAHNVIRRAGELALLLFPVHPHMLRHACGYYLASKGQDTRALQAYLGYKNTQHTVKYQTTATLAGDDRCNSCHPTDRSFASAAIGSQSEFYKAFSTWCM
jgi:integrase